jgi:hypothetical protein
LISLVDYRLGASRDFVHEVLEPFVTEFIRNFGGEDATPIQHAFPTAPLLDHLQAGQTRQTYCTPKVSGAALHKSTNCQVAVRLTLWDRFYTTRLLLW